MHLLLLLLLQPAKQKISNGHYFYNFTARNTATWIVTKVHSNVMCLVVVSGKFKVNESYFFCQNKTKNSNLY